MRRRARRSTSRDKAGPAARRRDRQADRRRCARRARPVRLNNRVRRTVEAALGGLTLLAPDPAKRLEAAQAVFKSRDPAALPALDAALAKETDAKVKQALLAARASVILTMADAKEADKLDAIAVLSERGDQEALGLLSGPAGRRAGVGAQGRGRCDRRDSEPARDVGHGAERLVRAFARLGAAARRDRACHHVRRHGRHQHGARRDGDARRLRHLRGAGTDPHQQPGAVRLFAADRGAAGLHRRRRDRHPDRAQHHPLSSTAGRWRRCSRPGACR